jgi:hypothetical protein
MQSDRAQRIRDSTSRMREIRMSGSVGAPEERASGATRQPTGFQAGGSCYAALLALPKAAVIPSICVEPSPGWPAA